MKCFRWLVVVEVVAFGLLVLPPTVAAAAVGEGCPNESLRSELSSGLLPECRAYEMVTPAYKEGYPVLDDSFAGDGEQAILGSTGEFAGTPGGGRGSEESLYLDRRTPGGWRLSPLNAPGSRFVGQEPVAVGVEAQSGETLWVQHTPAQSFSTRDLYIRSVSGEYALVGPLAPPVEGEGPSNLMLAYGENSPKVGAATSDYGHILLYAQLPAIDGWRSFDHTTSGGSLYEYSGTGRSQPILVGVTGAEKGSEDLVNTCGIEPGSLGAGNGLGSMYNALSVSGEAVFFTVEPCSGEQAEVYERLHGALTSPGAAETVDISASECTSACGGVSGKEFEGASEDGERVFFTSTQKLTDGAVDGTASGNATSSHSSGEGASCATIVPGAGGCNLYEYDAGAPVGERLVLVAGGEVQGVVGIAEDGARVYYVSREEVPGAGINEFGKGPVAGGDNLYVYDALDGRTVFVATLENEPDAASGEPDLWSKYFVVRPGEVAGSGGRFLLFASDTPRLTPDDTGPLEQLFEYDAETGELVRVSQGENGYNENGNGVLTGIEPEGAIAIHNAPLGDGDFHTGSNLLNISGDGRTVAFETAGRLSERATAAEQGCTSVYVFHAGGRLSEGSVHLVSDGKDAQEFKGFTCGAEFVGMDEDGTNVLFATADSLVAGDTDGGQRDIYDARIDGGFPAATAGWSCEEHGCEGSTNGSVSAPMFAAPDSTAGTGAGNLPSAPVTSSQVKHAAKKKRVVCGKRRRRVHGRCLAPRAKTKQARSRKADGKRRHQS